MRWRVEDIDFQGISDADSEGDVVTAVFETPVGTLKIMAEVDLDESGAVLLARNTHIQSYAEPGAIGIGNLHLIARLLLERLGCHEALVEGAPRTTGARPGRRPSPFRFRR